ncbi:hypothetical protein DUNSADRAFT_11169 [Dunaliella salina]|uniref:Uncharacterized protein n=1 Tax=Dunaliella salina TaxID=3046 RepID=A0ABQ7GDZ1_DUNSA|nr:hypothetical protein DUNSADRAFT_11169 [Dunaliella salina]|eukprot:KAF5832830.1 hypothetical protein DUNSADRAFT_11169 [Dunaliella salina]
MKLRRRCGLDSADKRPRPYATTTHKKRAPLVATTSPTSSGSWSEGDGVQPRLAGSQSAETSTGKRGRPRKQQDGARRSAAIARRPAGRKAAASQARAMDTDNVQRVSVPARRGTRAATAAAAAVAEDTAGSEGAGLEDMVMSGAGAGVGRVGRAPGLSHGKATTRALHAVRDKTGNSYAHQRQSIGSESAPQRTQRPHTAITTRAERDGAVGRAKGGSAEVQEAVGRVGVGKHVRKGVRSVRGNAAAVEAAGVDVHAKGAGAYAGAKAAAAATAATGDAAVHAEPKGRLTRGQHQQQLQQQQQQVLKEAQEHQQEQEQVEEQDGGTQRRLTQGLRQQAEERPGPQLPRLPRRGQRRSEAEREAAAVRTRKGGEVERGMSGDAAQQELKGKGQGLRHKEKDQTWQGAPHTLKRTRRRKTAAMLHEQGGREELMDVDGDEGRQGGRLVGVDDPMLLEEDATAASGDCGDGGGGVRKRRRVARRARKEGQGGNKEAEGGGEKMGNEVGDRGGKRMRVTRLVKGVEKGASEGEHESPPKGAARRRGRGQGREKQQQQQQQQEGLVESEGHDGVVGHQGLADQRQQQQHMQQAQLQQHGQQLQQQQGEGSSQPPGEAPGSESEPTSADSVLPRPPSPPSVCARRRGARRAAAPRPNLPVAAGRQHRGVARGGQRGGDPDIEKARPADADGLAHPSTSQSSGAHRTGAFGLVVRQAGPAATPMAYLPAPGSTPTAAAPAVVEPLAPAAAAAAAATASTAAGAETAAASGERGVGGLRGVGHTRAYARSPLGRISDNLPVGPAHPSFAQPQHRLPAPSAMLPPRFAGTKAANNSGGGGWSGGKLMAGSGPGMSSAHSIVGSTHGMKTGEGIAGGNGGGSGGGREVAPPPTARAPHHAAAGSHRPPVAPRTPMLSWLLWEHACSMEVKNESVLHLCWQPPPACGAPRLKCLSGFYSEVYVQHEVQK